MEDNMIIVDHSICWDDFLSVYIVYQTWQKHS